MPKVSQEHMERRRQQILDAARECFAKQGFHNTSMQDIFRVSGLSAGAVYRYFPSKEQLMRAIAEETLATVLGRLSQAGETAAGDSGRDPAEIMRILTEIFADEGPLAGRRPIIVQVWAEAPRDPSMAAIARDLLAQLVERTARLLPDGTPPGTARLLVATMQGFLVQSLVFEDVTPELVGAAARGALR